MKKLLYVIAIFFSVQPMIHAESIDSITWGMTSIQLDIDKGFSKKFEYRIAIDERIVEEIGKNKIDPIVENIFKIMMHKDNTYVYCTAYYLDTSGNNYNIGMAFSKYVNCKDAYSVRSIVSSLKNTNLRKLVSVFIDEIDELLRKNKSNKVE